MTHTTHELLSYWFNRDEETKDYFYSCQQRAIEMIIHCHEILRIRTLGACVSNTAPESGKNLFPGDFESGSMVTHTRS